MSAATTMSNPQGRDPFNVRASFNVIALLVDGHATCVAVFMRRGFGVEALGLSGVVAFVMILLYAGATHDPLMTLYFFAWLLALIFQRILTHRLVKQGFVEHSRYNGWPWLALKFRFVKTEIAAKNAVEPAICLFGGVLLCPLSEALGGFVMLGFFSLLIQRGLESQVNMSRVQRMRDAEIEQRQLAERFRGQRNDY